MNKKKPTARDYQLGTCYLCQVCLTCNKTLVFDTCECDISEKSKTNKQKKKEITVEFIIRKRLYNYKLMNYGNVMNTLDIVLILINLFSFFYVRNVTINLLD